MSEIKGFFGDYRFLSNFWGCRIAYEGVVYPSTEHAYQAAKTLDEDERADILFYLDEKGKVHQTTAAQAKEAGKHVTLRPDWEDVKISIMTKLVRQKFEQDDELRAKLLATGDAYLEETNHWGDKFWGVCKGVGRNELGKLLMRIRDDLQLLNY